ncbi:MAG: SUKH-3 domain-containing protein [Acidobacteriota bacterium]
MSTGKIASDNTIQILKAAGWYEGRKIDIEVFESNLNKLGYEVFQPVKQFLQEFGMLKFQDALEQVHDTSKIFIEYFKHGKFSIEENYCGERLVPVGTLSDGELLLFVSESGKVYCSTGKLGDNPWEAWECLINNTSFKSWGTLQRDRG